ncbi:MAG TPA: hypothetical protein VHW09_03685 [Bryobacteraceae bacterium]|nr:hypothetical protein [Bryobacteraceae bacterium]
MLANFLYSAPIWLVGFLVIGLWTGLSLLGLNIFHKRVDVHLRHKDTETVGLTYAIVAVVYAVLLALITVDVFENFARADTIATAESNRLSNLILDSTGLPPQMAAEMRSDLNKYIDIVVKKEWPSQRDGQLAEDVFEPGWTLLAHINTELAVFEPATLGQNVDKAEMLHAMNELIKARRSRIIAAGEHLPVVIWKMLVLGGAISVIFTFLFGARTFRIHMAITGLIAATIGLVFVLIITMDFPFRGTVSVTSDSFLNVQQSAAGALAALPHH